MNRYSKQSETIKPLTDKTVVIVGCGGLGSTIADQLCRVGVGRLILIDSDKIDLSNIHRTSVFNDRHIGHSKVAILTEEIKKIGYCNVSYHHSNFATASEVNLKSIASQIDLIIDATDNLSVRYEIEDFCTQYSIAWLYGGVNEFYGKVKLFPANCKVNFSRIFGRRKNPNHIKEYTRAYPPAVFMVATMQVSEAVKFLNCDPSVGALISIDLKSNKIETGKFE